MCGYQLLLAGDPVGLGVDQRAVHVEQHPGEPSVAVALAHRALKYFASG